MMPPTTAVGAGEGAAAQNARDGAWRDNVRRAKCVRHGCRAGRLDARALGGWIGLAHKCALDGSEALGRRRFA